jgi:Tfp pilus assembly protein PilX
MVSNLKNEEGTAIVIVLIILVALTLIGVIATNTAVVELQIVRSEALYEQNFYRAESAAIEASQWLEDNLTLTTTPAWMINDGTVNSDMTNLINWRDGADPPNWVANVQKSPNLDDAADLQNNTCYAAVSHGIADGSSLSMTGGTNLYDHSIYGLFDSTNRRGRSLIGMGYKKRY